MGSQQNSTPSVNFTVTPPTITSLQPSVAVAGQGAFTMTVNGSGFFQLQSPQTVTPLLQIGSLTLPTTVVNANQITANIPASITAAPQTYTVQVLGPGENASNSVNFQVVASLFAITTPQMTAAIANSPYDFTFSTRGGFPPLQFSISGLPNTLRLNTATGEVTGTPTAQGSFPINLTVTDSEGEVASASFTLRVLPPPIPLLQFTGAQLPNGTVGVQYNASISVAGGVPPYTFALSGSLPPGLSMSSNGTITGTPTAAGTSTFAVQVTDSAVSSSTTASYSPSTISAPFSITILVPPLTLVTATLANAPQGSPLNLPFVASGGTPPYTFSAGTGLPPGTSLSAGGVLSGSPTIQGTYSFPVTVQDSLQGSFTRNFTLTVVAPLITILEKSLPPGQVGAAFSTQLFASGGSTPYTWSITGAPAGLTMSPNGLLSGTPTADGTFTPTVTVTDPAKDVTTMQYLLIVTPAPLLITTQSLAGGAAGTAYTATLTATGGDAPYTWTATGLPSTLTLSPAGTLSGTPTSSGTYSVVFTVTDSKKVTASVTLGLTIQGNPVTITTKSLPSGTLSVAYSAALAASGGAGSNKWAATGLPPGLSISPGGTISGTPTTAGQYVTVVTVTDAAGTLGVQTYAISILLPTTPALSFSSLPTNGNPGTQTNVQVGLSSAYPIPVTATLSLAFTPDSGPDDPGVQFSTGGRSVTVAIPAGSTSLTGAAAIQYGTTAGTITITANLVAAGQDITPSPQPSVSVRVAPAAPVISSVTAVRGSSGFTVTVTGFATPRQVTQATFTFAAQSSANLQTNSVTAQVSGLFSSWYSSGASAPFGSQFAFVQSFSVNGSVAGITSVTVTLTNAQGNSAAVTANLQ